MASAVLCSVVQNIDSKQDRQEYAGRLKSKFSVKYPEIESKSKIEIMLHSSSWTKGMFISSLNKISSANPH
jgi:hypothetical protein